MAPNSNATDLLGEANATASSCPEGMVNADWVSASPCEINVVAVKALWAGLLLIVLFTIARAIPIGTHEVEKLKKRKTKVWIHPWLSTGLLRMVSSMLVLETIYVALCVNKIVSDDLIGIDFVPSFLMGTSAGVFYLISNLMTNLQVNMAMGVLKRGGPAVLKVKATLAKGALASNAKASAVLRGSSRGRRPALCCGWRRDAVRCRCACPARCVLIRLNASTPRARRSSSTLL